MSFCICLTYFLRALSRPERFLLGGLLLASVAARAQPEESPAPARTVYANARGHYQLRYPRSWPLSTDVAGAEAAFYAYGARHPALAVVTLAVQALPNGPSGRRLTGPGALDSLRQQLLRLPQARVLSLDQPAAGRYEEQRYDYTYAPVPATPGGRVHVLGRQVRRGGTDYRIEYRADERQDAAHLAEGERLVESFAFTDTPAAGRRQAKQPADNPPTDSPPPAVGKLYGIAAVRRHNGQWEDDCRTIHEFRTTDLTAAPVVHQRVLPFQSYALAEGFDHCLYSVTKAPTNAPERVYRYDPATRRGGYTGWELPAQGPENVWISASTDDRGDLYFLTSDANLLVKISPGTGAVTSVWTTDPVQKAPYFPYIGFEGAGTHGNFCLEDANTLYLVYSTDGSLLKVSLNTRQPFPERIPLTGLPARGGYSDLLLQTDAPGRQRLYLAGPHALYQVDLARREAHRVRPGTYTDLAGGVPFRVPPPPTAPPPAPARLEPATATAPAAAPATAALAPAATATWRARVLSATTREPLPTARLRLNATEGASTAILLDTRGAFAYTTAPGRYRYHAEAAGYFATDSVWVALPGTGGQNVLLRPLALGATLPLANVQFAQGEAVLLPTSSAALDQLVALLLDNPTLTIEVRGHTDNVGPPERNLTLSEERVAAVKAYLVGRGVAASRISGIGLGGTQPTASNELETTRRLNRRVEFRVTGL